MMVECDCFIFNYDPMAPDETCDCGHQLDEHEDGGECRAMVEEI